MRVIMNADVVAPFVGGAASTLTRRAPPFSDLTRTELVVRPRVPGPGADVGRVHVEALARAISREHVVLGLEEGEEADAAAVYGDVARHRVVRRVVEAVAAAVAGRPVVVCGVAGDGVVRRCREVEAVVPVVHRDVVANL